jgi:hypothetical protein
VLHALVLHALHHHPRAHAAGMSENGDCRTESQRCDHDDRNLA